MYRIFKESLNNLIDNTDGVRKQYLYCFDLLGDIDKFNAHKKLVTDKYKVLNSVLNYISDNIDLFPRLNCFMWEIETLGITLNKSEVNSDLSDEYLNEAAKMLVSIMKLNYWWVN